MDGGNHMGGSLKNKGNDSSVSTDSSSETVLKNAKLRITVFESVKKTKRELEDAEQSIMNMARVQKEIGASDGAADLSEKMKELENLKNSLPTAEMLDQKIKDATYRKVLRFDNADVSGSTIKIVKEILDDLQDAVIFAESNTNKAEQAIGKALNGIVSEEAERFRPLIKPQVLSVLKEIASKGAWSYTVWNDIFKALDVIEEAQLGIKRIYNKWLSEWQYALYGEREDDKDNDW
jgi:hypothetical protein